MAASFESKSFIHFHTQLNCIGGIRSCRRVRGSRSRSRRRYTLCTLGTLVGTRRMKFEVWSWANTARWHALDSADLTHSNRDSLLIPKTGKQCRFAMLIQQHLSNQFDPTHTHRCWNDWNVLESVKAIEQAHSSIICSSYRLMDTRRLVTCSD